MNDLIKTAAGVLTPFFGTALGAAAVFFIKKKKNKSLENGLLGFAAGVMMAASVWSLLIPAIELSDNYGRLAFIPAAVGFLFGTALLSFFDLILGRITKKAEAFREKDEHGRNGSRTLMLILAVTLHNLPEGMAVGVAFAGLLTHSAEISFAGAMTLSLGIALQNIPEGAIVSMPLGASVSKGKAFLRGVLSGAVEPIGALLTLALSFIIVPTLPYLLSFAAGAMIYVVVKELIPGSQESADVKPAMIGSALGFVIMMSMDAALG